MNVNDSVYVRLTEAGKAVLESFFQEVDLRLERYSIPNASVVLRTHREMVDASNGWYCFPLWEFMQIFGSKCFQFGPQLFEKNRVMTTKPASAVDWSSKQPAIIMF